MHTMDTSSTVPIAHLWLKLCMCALNLNIYTCSSHIYMKLFQNLYPNGHFYYNQIAPSMAHLIDLYLVEIEYTNFKWDFFIDNSHEIILKV